MAVLLMFDNKFVHPLACPPISVATSLSLAVVPPSVHSDSTWNRVPIYNFHIRSDSHRPDYRDSVENVPVDSNNFCMLYTPVAVCHRLCRLLVMLLMVSLE